VVGAAGGGIGVPRRMASNRLWADAVAVGADAEMEVGASGVAGAGGAGLAAGESEALAGDDGLAWGDGDGDGEEVAVGVGGAVRSPTLPQPTLAIGGLRSPLSSSRTVPSCCSLRRSGTFPTSCGTSTPESLTHLRTTLRDSKSLRDHFPTMQLRNANSC